MQVCCLLARFVIVEVTVVFKLRNEVGGGGWHHLPHVWISHAPKTSHCFMPSYDPFALMICSRMHAPALFTQPKSIGSSLSRFQVTNAGNMEGWSQDLNRKP